MPRADLYLDPDNRVTQAGITFANGRLYTVDHGEDKVYIVSPPFFDLVVRPPAASNSNRNAGGRFTLRVPVHNQGNAPSAETMLRYYRSSDAIISIEDTEVGTDSVSPRGGGRTIDEVITLNAPSSDGTYYYGACVDPVSGESDTRNNCSSANRVTIGESGSDTGGPYPVYDLDISRASLDCSIFCFHSDADEISNDGRGDQ